MTKLTLLVETDDDIDWCSYGDYWSDWESGIVARREAIGWYRGGKAPGIEWQKLWNNSSRSLNGRPLPYWTDLLTLEQFLIYKNVDPQWLSDETLDAAEKEELQDAVEEWEDESKTRENWLMKVYRWTGHHLVEADDEDIDDRELTFIILPNISDEMRLVYASKKRLLPEEIIETLAEETSAVWRGEVWRWTITDQEGEIADSCCGYTSFPQCESEGEAQLKCLLQEEEKNESTRTV